MYAYFYLHNSLLPVLADTCREPLILSSRSVSCYQILLNLLYRSVWKRILHLQLDGILCILYSIYRKLFLWDFWNKYVWKFAITFGDSFTVEDPQYQQNAGWHFQSTIHSLIIIYRPLQQNSKWAICERCFI